jgi:phospholipase/carboxylesterase
MNRIPGWNQPSSSSPVVASIDTVALGRLQRDSGVQFFRPQHYEANYAYPLVVWLHGEGGSEQNLAQVMPLTSLRNYLGVAVRGNCRWDSGYTWSETVDAVDSAAEKVLDAVDLAAARFNVHPQRIFLVGHRAGGTLAVRLALRLPEAFAGAVSISGRFPRGQMPLRNLHSIRRLPILLTHGRTSRRYSIDHVCRELSLFHAAGMQVDLRQYPCGDELTTKMLSDVNAWLMSRVTGQPVACDDGERTCEEEWN